MSDEKQHTFGKRAPVAFSTTGARGIVYERYWLIDTAGDTPAEPAYRVRFSDGRDLGLAESALSAPATPGDDAE